MKKLHTIIDSDIVDAEKNKIRDNGKPITTRFYLKSILNMPIKNVAMTRDRSKMIDKICNKLDIETVLLEDAEIEFLSKYIDEVGIVVKPLYDAVIMAVDSAEEYAV